LRVVCDWCALFDVILLGLVWFKCHICADQVKSITVTMNGGETSETAAKSSSAHVIELGQEEAGSSSADAPEKVPEVREVVVIAIDGSKQAESAFACTFSV